MRFVCWFLLLALSCPNCPSLAQRPDSPVQASSGVVPNYDEQRVGQYTLPNPLVRPDGTLITRKDEWESQQRDQILSLFKEHVYGQMPGRPVGMHALVQRVDTAVLDGRATRKFIRVWFGPGTEGPHVDLMLYLPRTARKVPVFVALNYGNHTTSPDPSIPLPSNAEPALASAVQRGAFARRWPVAQLIDAGFGLATADYADLEPDRPMGWKTGIRTTLAKSLRLEPSQWSAIGAWAWGMSRILDYLETDSAVDASRVIVQGHSRLGKAALWAGANDRRFAMVISNSSGEGGAALARRNYGETIGLMTGKFPYWFIDRYATYAAHVTDLPVDQHELLALVAPRPLYVTSAVEDRWADPRGEFLSLQAASPVWQLYGKQPVPEPMPSVDEPAHWGKLGYHIRTGRHDVLPYDWAQYVRHAQAVDIVPK